MNESGLVIYKERVNILMKNYGILMWKSLMNSLFREVFLNKDCF